LHNFFHESCCIWKNWRPFLQNYGPLFMNQSRGSLPSSSPESHPSQSLVSCVPWQMSIGSYQSSRHRIDAAQSHGRLGLSCAVLECNKTFLIRPALWILPPAWHTKQVALIPLYSRALQKKLVAIFDTN
jgi:hypothetical protein